MKKVHAKLEINCSFATINLTISLLRYNTPRFQKKKFGKKFRKKIWEKNLEKNLGKKFGKKSNAFWLSMLRI
jgi:hypothetical protein